MFSVQYAYLSLGLIFLLFWFTLFLRRKDLRNEMLVSSVITGILGVCFEFFFIQDYWTPILWNNWAVGFEDFLYGFSVVGIAAVAYEELFRKRCTKKRSHTHHWRYLLFFYFISLSVFFVAREFLGVNTMYSALGSFLAAFTFMMFVRSDLWRDALWSGVLFLGITFLAYLPILLVFPDVVSTFWRPENISGILIFGVPLEEFLWAFIFGLVAGPFYEFWAGLRFNKSKFHMS
jgi:hypothetical protein